MGDNYGNIATSYSNGEVSGKTVVGGLVGNNLGSITASYSGGSVSGGWVVGGLVGMNSPGSVLISYSTSTVNGGEYVGGLVGYNGHGSIETSYSTGLVSGTEEVGGLVGSNTFYAGDVVAIVSHSFWDTQTSGQATSSGGMGKTTAEMQTGGTFLEAGWDFVGETTNGTEDVWWIDEGRAYPRLWWQYGRVSSPDPWDGARDVLSPLVLKWIGGGAEFSHDVYFGDDEAVVANATSQTQGVYRGRQTAETTTYDPGALECGATYYWRIDEVDEADPETPWKGSVRSFTIADYVMVSVVDDFESYTDDMDAEEAIFQTWIDGLCYGDPNNPAGDAEHPAYYAGNGTGSQVGYYNPPFAEQTIIHSRKQSMPMDYNNVSEPWYSEADRTWVTPQDWTIGGADTLTLYFRGEAGNSLEALYIGIEDSAGRIAVVVHPDAEAVRATEWQKWHIDLGEVRTVGVDLAAVKKMVIGVGDRENPQPGGTGRIYIDDIRLTKRMP